MKKVLLSIALVLSTVFGVVQPVMAEDVCSAPEGTFDESVLEAAGCKVDKEHNITDSVVGILDVVLAFVGVIAVGVVIYGGILYMKSNGDAAKVAQGRRTLIGGFAGLFIALLAYAIVQFVVQAIN